MSEVTDPQALAHLTKMVDLETYKPSHEQERAKARLQLALRERGEVTDLGSLTADEVAHLAGNRKLLTWLREPGFAAWLGDKNTWMVSALALQETVIAVLADILTSDYEPKILTAKDRLKAADMLLQLTGSYPAKSKEVRFLDKDLETMAPDVVQAELAKIRGELAAMLPAPRAD